MDWRSRSSFFRWSTLLLLDLMIPVQPASSAAGPASIQSWTAETASTGRGPTTLAVIIWFVPPKMKFQNSAFSTPTGLSPAGLVSAWPLDWPHFGPQKCIPLFSPTKSALLLLHFWHAFPSKFAVKLAILLRLTRPKHATFSFELSEIFFPVLTLCSSQCEEDALWQNYYRFSSPKNLTIRQDVFFAIHELSDMTTLGHSPS